MFHLLQALAGSGTADKQRGPAMAQMPPRVFSEPMAGLSGIDRVGQAHAVGAVAAGRSSLGGVSNGRSAEEERYAGAMTRRGEGQSVRRARGGTEVTERALLRGILYAFQVRFYILWRLLVDGSLAGRRRLRYFVSRRLRYADCSITHSSFGGRTAVGYCIAAILRYTISYDMNDGCW